tara:strand:+ start:2119 stop:2424 length:306 start_codon:yes stop_codon:yes gene_type:complete
MPFNEDGSRKAAYKKSGFKMKGWSAGEGTGSSFKNNPPKKPRYKQGELKKGYGEGIKTHTNITMDQAVTQAKEQNRLAEIKRMKEDGFYWDEASGTFKEMD